MTVNPVDGTCRECGGTLAIVEVSDDSMTVLCTACGESYETETDAFGDGGMTYYLRFLAAHSGRCDGAE